jgi:hypothetical protein
VSTPANPGSIAHQLAEWRFCLADDGSLTITPTGNGRPITITPAMVFALSLFVRMPGVRALLNRADLERQHKRHCNAQK